MPRLRIIPQEARYIWAYCGKVRKQTRYVEKRDIFVKKVNGRAKMRRTFGKRYPFIIASQENNKKKFEPNKQRLK